MLWREGEEEGGLDMGLEEKDRKEIQYGLQ